MAAAKAELEEWVKECEAIRADRIARNFELMVYVPSSLVNPVLSNRVSLCEKFDVALRLHKPQQNGVLNGCEASTDSKDEINYDQKTVLVLRGYEQNVNQAKLEMDKILEKLSNQVTENLYIPMQVSSF